MIGAPKRSVARAAAALAAALGVGEGEAVRHALAPRAEQIRSVKAVQRQNIEREYSPAGADDYSLAAETAGEPGKVKRAPRNAPMYWSTAPPATLTAPLSSGLKSKP